MKLKDLLACTVTGMLLCTSCIKDEAPNAEADILTCTVASDILNRDPIIQNTAITIMVKPGTDLSKQAPQFTLTEGATIEPSSGTERDFTTSQQYTVTSESKKWTKVYTVSYTSSEIPSFYHFEDSLENKDSKGKYFILAEKGNSVMEWASGNPGFALTGVAKSALDYPTVQVDNGVSGKCVKLETHETGSFGSKYDMPIAAGNIFIGTFNTLSALYAPLRATLFGLPFYHQPTKIVGYYKFKAGPEFKVDGKVIPGRKDMFNIYGIFYETDQNIHMLDGTLKQNNYSHPNLVALAMIDNQKETDEWTRFEIPFQYKYGKTLDLEKLKNGGYNMSIIFSSSIEGDMFEGAPGSTLYIDEVELIYEN